MSVRHAVFVVVALCTSALAAPQKAQDIPDAAIDSWIRRISHRGPWHKHVQALHRLNEAGAKAARARPAILPLTQAPNGRVRPAAVGALISISGNKLDDQTKLALGRYLNSVDLDDRVVAYTHKVGS